MDSMAVIRMPSNVPPGWAPASLPVRKERLTMPGKMVLAQTFHRGCTRLDSAQSLGCKLSIRELRKRTGWGLAY
eukprot:gene2956-4054_t